MNITNKKWESTDSYNLSDYIQLKSNMEELNHTIKVITPQYQNKVILKTYTVDSYIYKDFFNNIYNYLTTLTNYCGIYNDLVWVYSEFDPIFEPIDLMTIDSLVEQIYKYLINKYVSHENVLKSGTFKCSNNKVLQIMRW